MGHKMSEYQAYYALMIWNHGHFKIPTPSGDDPSLRSHSLTSLGFLSEFCLASLYSSANGPCPVSLSLSLAS